MTFEETVKEYEQTIDRTLTAGQIIIFRDFYNAGHSAAIFEAANRAGDTANEAEKIERRKVAIDFLKAVITDYVSDETLDTIIKVAQG